MAGWIVSDVVERLLGKLAQWHDQVDQMDPYFGGRSNLNQVEEALKKVQVGVVDAERQVENMFPGFEVNTVEESDEEDGAAADLTEERIVEDKEDRAAAALTKLIQDEENEAAAAAALAPVEEWLKKVKRVLYAMEELFDMVAIAEIDMQQIQFRYHRKLIRSLCFLYSKPSRKRLALQLESLIGDLLKTHNAKPRVEAVVLSEDHAEERHLEEQKTHMAHCFSYFSLFPKAYEYKKTDLIYLWMAQAFIGQPLHENHHLTPQQLGHQYYMEMADVDFFIQQTTNERGDISCKMNDGVHNHAATICRGGCLLVGENGDLMDSIDNNIYHLSIIVGSSWEPPSWLLAAKQLRSLFLFPRDTGTSVNIKNLEELLSSLTCLRALDLGRAALDNLPDSNGGLKHLRYLKLGGPLQSLPQSITRLHYLQTLDLQACPQLTNFPNKFNNNVTLLFSAEHHQFRVDECNSLDALIGSAKAVGKFEIFFKRHRRRAVSEARAADLKSKQVTDLIFEWSSSYHLLDVYAESNEEELVLNWMKPPQSLKSLVVRFWKGTRFPSWEMSSPYVNLPRLVSIEIEGCNRCTYLPSFSRLPSLKYLRLANLKALEYIEEIGVVDGYIDNEASLATYFLSLEKLKLEDLPELKGWSSQIPQWVFPQLAQLKIYLCPRLLSMPQAPSLKSLRVEEIHVNLLKHLQESPTTSSILPKLRKLQIVSVSQLDSLAVNYSDGIHIRIKRCEELVSLNFFTASHMRVQVYSCGRLRDISGAFQNMSLKIWRCKELELWNIMEKDDGGERGIGTSVGSAAWQGITELQYLTVGSITRLDSLSRGLHCFTKLTVFEIFQLHNLNSVPKCIRHLTSLHLLHIEDCSNMRTLFVSSDSLIINLPCLTLFIVRCQELVDDSFGGTPISLKGLAFRRCDRLKNISGKELKVDYLAVDNCLKLHLWEDNGEGSSSSGSVNSTAWQGLKSLCDLVLAGNSKMESLPRGLACLTALCTLKISKLHDLRELPEWIGHLSKLKFLHIENCPKLTQLPESLGKLTYLEKLRIEQCNPELESRCQKTTGEDWPKIKRISDIYVKSIG